MSSHSAVYADNNIGAQVGGDNNGSINVINNHYGGTTKTEVARPLVLPLRNISPFFVGRGAEIREIEARLFDASNTQEVKASRQLRICVIQGLGGSGKSELCLRYLATQGHRYGAIFWIDGSSQGSLESGYTQIALQLGLGGESVAAVRHNLTSRQNKWLLIVDNADDPQLDLSPYIPSSGHGHVLVTTRNPELSIYSTALSLRLEALARDDARDLLFSTAGIAQPNRLSMNQAADEILQALDYHTLATVQAGAFLRESSCKLTDYLPLFKQQRKRLLSFERRQVRSEYGHVYSTFEVSASKLQEEARDQGQESATDALTLLHLFAFMDARGPFEQMFSEAQNSATEYSKGSLKNSGPAPSIWSIFRQVPEMFKSPVQANEFIDSHFADEDRTILGPEELHSTSQACVDLLSPLAYMPNDMNGKTRWQKACGKLSQYSIITTEMAADGNEILIIHPLILAWALDRQSLESYRKSCFSVAATIFLSKLSRLEDGDRDSLLPHICACASHMLIEWWEEVESLPYVLLALDLASQMVAAGFYIASSNICACLERSLRTTLSGRAGRDYPLDKISLLVALHAILVGQDQKATELLEPVVNALERSAETNVFCLEFCMLLALAYAKNRQDKEAKQLLEHIVRETSSLSPKTFLMHSRAQVLLASLYFGLEGSKKAIEHYEAFVSTLTQTAEEADAHLLVCQSRLAVMYLGGAESTKAERLLEHVVDIQKRSLGISHHDVLLSQSRLAEAYLDQEGIEEAIQLLNHVIEKLSPISREENGCLLQSQRLLARAYSRQGQSEKAVPLLEHVAKIYEQITLETHPDRIFSQCELAKVYIERAQMDPAQIDDTFISRAIQIFEQVVTLQDQLTPETPKPPSAHLALAVAYVIKGRIGEAQMERELVEKAVRLVQHVIKTEEQTVAETGPQEETQSKRLLREFSAALDGNAM